MSHWVDEIKESTKIKVVIALDWYPNLKWAQRKDRVFIEISLQNVTDEHLDISETNINFNGISDSKKYSFDLELFSHIDVQSSKWNKNGLYIVLVLYKKDQDKEYWPRLTKASAKNQYIQIDWSKWIDEEDEEEEAEKGLGVIDPSQMQAFRGYPGMDRPDSDEDEDEEGVQ